jgi:hypothetical protein
MIGSPSMSQCEQMVLNGSIRSFSGGLERFGAVGNFAVRAKLLKALVGAWGFEPQTPTVSR